MWNGSDPIDLIPPTRPHRPHLINPRRQSQHPTELTGMSQRRSHPFLAQVPSPFGAGVTFSGGPAPQKGLVCTALAQVWHLFPHLHHLPRGPAPPEPVTCAKCTDHLRQQPSLPTPNTQDISALPITCEKHPLPARNTYHLRHKDPEFHC